MLFRSNAYPTVVEAVQAAKKYGREEDKDGNVSYDMTKDTSKGSVLTFKDRMLARVKEAFEK